MLSAYQGRLVTASAVNSKRPRSPLWALVFILGGLLFAGIPNAQAAFVTTNEAGMDAVFSQQPSFDGTPIDIRFLPTITFTNGTLLNINDSIGLNTLFAFNDATDPNVVSMYFVDSISFCASEIPAIVGCAAFPGNDIVVESAVAAGAFGTELLAHELGHNLGLGHTTGSESDNLMWSILNGNTTLTPLQVATILGSPLIQMDSFGRYIEITPVLVATPLPPAGILFVTAILALIGVRSRRKASV